MKIGSRIKRRRQALGLRQQELAREVGVTPQHVSKLEREHAVPSLETLVALSRALGVSTDYLLIGHETATAIDIRSAIRAQPISATAKRILIQLVGELTSRG